MADYRNVLWLIAVTCVALVDDYRFAAKVLLAVVVGDKIFREHRAVGVLRRHLTECCVRIWFVFRRIIPKGLPLNSASCKKNISGAIKA